MQQILKELQSGKLKLFPFMISKCLFGVWRALKLLMCWYWQDFRSLTTFHYRVWTEVQLSSCTPWEFQMNISASKPAWVVSVLDSLVLLGTGRGRARTWKFWGPSRFHQTARESGGERKASCFGWSLKLNHLCWLFHALHFRIVFFILYSCLHKRQHLGDGHIKKKAPKCSEIRYAFTKPFFFLDVEIHNWTEASWEQKAWFLICLTFRW